MLVNTFLASLAAKLAMATGLAVATVTAAGAAGVLPEPAQKVVASAVEATTPFALPDAGDDVVGDVVDDVDDVDDVTTTTLGTSTTIAGDDDEAGDDGTTDGTRKENHGLCVSTVAKNTPGGPDKGKTVSSVARSDCGKTTATTVAPTTSSTTVTTIAPTTTSTVAGLVPSTAGSGKGNSGNSANSGKGNSGKN